MYIERIGDIRRCMKEISSRPDGQPFFSDKTYTAYPIDESNFSAIGEAFNGTIAFVDGGNAEIISSPSMCVNFVRAYGNVFRKNAKSGQKKTEFFILTYIEGDEYRSRIFPLKGDLFPLEDHLNFNSLDNTLRDGIFAFGIQKVGAVARRFAEWLMISSMEADVIVRDGSLQTGITNEGLYCNRAYEHAIKNNHVLCGLCKTSTLCTTTGKNLVSVIASMGNKTMPGKTWKYNPIARIENTDHRAEMFVAKFHEHASHAFRLEVLKDMSSMSDEAISAAMQNSRDARFLGYPYGLLEADNSARITEREKEYYKSVFYSSRIEKDPHEILNRVIS